MGYTLREIAVSRLIVGPGRQTKRGRDFSPKGPGPIDGRSVAFDRQRRDTGSYLLIGGVPMLVGYGYL